VVHLLLLVSPRPEVHHQLEVHRVEVSILLVYPLAVPQLPPAGNHLEARHQLKDHRVEHPNRLSSHHPPQASQLDDLADSRLPGHLNPGLPDVLIAVLIVDLREEVITTTTTEAITTK
ncbi:hypothetical protein WG66_002459, partial [Moniliophthora roreri]